MKLTDLPRQQRRVVELMAKGQRMSEIANSMNLSKSSVGQYIAVISDKIGARGQIAIMLHFYKLEPR